MITAKMTDPAHLPPPPCYLICVLGITATLLFLWLASTNISGQGIYCDELHQATEAFPHGENQPVMFGALKINDITALNMTYSGAIKTNIYKCYLSFIGAEFSIESWRLLGIFFVSFGIFAFVLIASRKMPIISSIIFLSFLILDSTVILSSRHDYGPAALALCLRLLFLACWISGELSENARPANSFLLGAISGFSIFEKLSSVVLLAPLFIMMVRSPGRRRPNHFIFLLLGGLIGGMPLIIVNVYSLLHSGTFVSLSGVEISAHYPFGKYLYQFISMGTGDLLKEFIMGVPISSSMYIELVLSAGILLLAFLYNLRKKNTDKYTELSQTLLLGYFSLIIFIYCLPKLTYVHHWLIGTPFQYLAISLTCTSIINSKEARSKTRLGYFAIALLFVILVSRVSGTISLERSLRKGESSSSWDHSLSEIGYFANKQPNDTVFLVADWGVSPQIFCLSNGRSDFVYELYKYYPQTDTILEKIKANRKRTIYVVTMKKQYRTGYELAAPFVFARLKNKGEWQETVVENEINDLNVIAVRKFTFVPH